MSKRVTWSGPDGSWGINGVELGQLPPGVYRALYRLMQLENLMDQLNDFLGAGWRTVLAAKMEHPAVAIEDRKEAGGDGAVSGVGDGHKRRCFHP